MVSIYCYENQLFSTVNYPIGTWAREWMSGDKEQDYRVATKQIRLGRISQGENHLVLLGKRLSSCIIDKFKHWKHLFGWINKVSEKQKCLQTRTLDVKIHDRGWPDCDRSSEVAEKYRKQEKHTNKYQLKGLAPKPVGNFEAPIVWLELQWITTSVKEAITIDPYHSSNLYIKQLKQVPLVKDLILLFGYYFETWRFYVELKETKTLMMQLATTYCLSCGVVQRSGRGRKLYSSPHHLSGGSSVLTRFIDNHWGTSLCQNRFSVVYTQKVIFQLLVVFVSL